MLGSTNSSEITQSGITITFDLYSAAQDTVYYYENGNPVTLCTTDATGKASGVTLTIPSSGLTLTLYSTVASFSKNITFDRSTTVVNLMRDSAIFWFGNVFNSKTGGFQPSGRQYISYGNLPSATITAGSNIIINPLAGNYDSFATTLNKVNLTNIKKFYVKLNDNYARFNLCLCTSSSGYIQDTSEYEFRVQMSELTGGGSPQVYLADYINNQIYQILGTPSKISGFYEIDIPTISNGAIQSISGEWFVVFGACRITGANPAAASTMNISTLGFE